MSLIQLWTCLALLNPSVPTHRSEPSHALLPERYVGDLVGSWNSDNFWWLSDFHKVSVFIQSFTGRSQGWATACGSKIFTNLDLRSACNLLCIHAGDHHVSHDDVQVGLSGHRKQHAPRQAVPVYGAHCPCIASHLESYSSDVLARAPYCQRDATHPSSTFITGSFRVSGGQPLVQPP